jgi:hypothetical protein
VALERKIKRDGMWGCTLNYVIKKTGIKAKLERRIDRLDVRLCTEFVRLKNRDQSGG